MAAIFQVALKSFFGVVLPQLSRQLQNRAVFYISHPHLLDGFLALVIAMEHGRGEIKALGD